MLFTSYVSLHYELICDFKKPEIAEIEVLMLSKTHTHTHTHGNTGVGQEGVEASGG